MNRDRLANAVDIASSTHQAAQYIAEVRTEAEGLVEACERRGLVLTIEQRPLQPLAMGNYETVASVRPARSRS